MLARGMVTATTRRQVRRSIAARREFYELRSKTKESSTNGSAQELDAAKLLAVETQETSLTPS
jgi:hypothetical protein